MSRQRQTCKVAVRLKPKFDVTDDAVQCVDNAENPTLLINKGIEEDGLYQFNFTKVLNNVCQVDVEEACSKDIVSSVLDGYNGTIMAYGQTGSGKTYTMTGPENVDLDHYELQGIMPRAITQVFRDIRRRRFVNSKVSISYVEIYNETFRDLLEPNTKPSDLSIAESKKGVVSLKNVKCPQCETAQDAMEVLLEGQRNRHVAGHGLNQRSSRSHTIFTLWVETTDAEGASFSSKLNLVDLAGSERYTKTGTEGSVAKEAMHINKSLSFLEQVIIALSKRKAQHVPYRSSKLTHFLKDSIGGNCQTVLIACIWSDAEQLSETLSTCRFAQRMMQVTVDAQKNKGGLAAVHGNLFKLDPVMQQYLEQMTAAAVAREKAKLYAEFNKHGGAGGGAAGLEELAPGELAELEALRHKVRDLEVLRDQVAQNHGVTEVDADTLEEMMELRNRVLQLEAQRAAEAEVALPALALDQADLLAEMEELRSRVLQLQEERELTESEVAELTTLRKRVCTLAAAQQAAEEADGQGTSSTAELAEMYELRQRVLAVQAQAESPSDDQLAELAALRERVMQLQATQDNNSQSDVAEEDEEKAALRAKVAQLEQSAAERAADAATSSALSHSTMLGSTDAAQEALLARIRELEEQQAALPAATTYEVATTPLAEDSCDSHRGGASASESSTAEEERAALVAKIRQLEEQQATIAAQEQAAKAEAEARAAAEEEARQAMEARMRDLELAEQRLRQQAEQAQEQAAAAAAAAAPDPLMCTGDDFGYEQDWDKEHKSKGLGRLFGRLRGRKDRRRNEHESFSGFSQLAPEEVVEEDTTPNIVILNSLTHDQLMELLKAHSVTGNSSSQPPWAAAPLPGSSLAGRRVPGLPRSGAPHTVGASRPGGLPIAPVAPLSLHNVSGNGISSSPASSEPAACQPSRSLPSGKLCSQPTEAIAARIAARAARPADGLQENRGQGTQLPDGKLGADHLCSFPVHSSAGRGCAGE